MTAAPMTDATPMTLVVAWRTGTAAHGRRIKIGGTVHTAFIEYANSALAKTSSGGGREYDPDDDQEEAPFVRADRDEAWDVSLLAELSEGANLPEASKDDMKRTFACYALVTGPSDVPTLFIRKATPVKLAGKPLVGQLLDGTFTRIDEPLLSFDPYFDVIVTPDEILALNQKNFEGLFKESAAVLARVEEWVTGLNAALPLKAGSVEYLTTALTSNTFLRRKVVSILRRPYLRTLTADAIRETIANHGLDEDELLPGGELAFTRENTRELLWILNQDIYSGDFSGETFAAGSKRRLD